MLGVESEGAFFELRSEFLLQRDLLIGLKHGEFYACLIKAVLIAFLCPRFGDANSFSFSQYTPR